jgi:hypothetical protein
LWILVCKQTIHTTTGEKWLLIKTKIQEIIDKHVPSKTLRQKQDIPMATSGSSKSFSDSDQVEIDSEISETGTANTTHHYYTY